MSSQEAWLLDARVSPTSEGSFNVDSVLSSGSRKRKRDGNSMDAFLDNSFIVKPYPSTVFNKPHTLRPIALIHRSCLPLACLDTNSLSNPLPESRLFEAHVRILELEQRMGNKPVVLIARLDDGKTLYAVERESRGLYVLCRLGSWVDLRQLCAEAVVGRPQSLDIFKISESASNTQDIGHGNITTEDSKYNKKKRLAIEAIQLMMKRPSGDLPSISQSVQVVEQGDSTVNPESRLPKQMLEDVILGQTVEQPAAADILDNIKLQYLEALYLSKASLGYFAKGPLSRARAAFHLDYDSTLDMTDLVVFLDSLILPTTVLDKKYKDGVPGIVSPLFIGEGSADEAEVIKAGTKRKSRKIKIGKNGLYPSEDTYLRRWWAAYDDDSDLGATGGSKDEIGRKRIAQLRIRETQLQIIVILEALALQQSAISHADQSGDLPIGSAHGEIAEKKAVSKGKAKKPRDLPGLIDVHVDRLCIWQSVAAEEGRPPSRSGNFTDNTAKSGRLADAQRHAADVLREFCVEVIVPFFSARLPEQCGAISRKLGGPVNSSPPGRPKLTKSATTSGVLSRPGAVTKRPVPVKSRRSLQRVLTDERHSRESSRGRSGAISLMRSATAPIPGLKREVSESPSLSTIPAADSQALHVSRGGVLKSKKFSHREVDLSCMVHINDAKSKKANIEAELKEAITALKRPNRQLAGQSLAEIAEKRVSTTPLHSRKSKKPVRNPVFQGVQILATPKADRKKTIETGGLPIPTLDLSQGFGAQTIPPSSLPRIPQSVARFGNSRTSDISSTCKATPVQSRPGRNDAPTIHATPSRCSTQIRMPAANVIRSPDPSSRIPPSSPLQARHVSKQQMLSAPRPLTQVVDTLDKFVTPIKFDKVQLTPMKQTAGVNIENEDPFHTVTATPLFKVSSSEGLEDIVQDAIRPWNDDSIYKSLGWDDYDEM